MTMNLLARLMPTHAALANDAGRKIHTHLGGRTELPTMIGGDRPAAQIDRLSVLIEALHGIAAENPAAPAHEQLVRIRSLAIGISQEARDRLKELHCDEAGVCLDPNH